MKKAIDVKKSYSPRSSVGIATFSQNDEATPKSADRLTLRDLYNKVDLVRNCIEAISYSVLGSGYHLEPLYGEKIDSYEASVVNKFFYQINTEDTIEELIIDWSQDMLTYGQGYAEKVYINKDILAFKRDIENKVDIKKITIPYKIYKANAYTMYIRATKEGQILGYDQKNEMGTVVRDFPTTKIVHFKLPTPVDDIYGLAPAATMTNPLAAYLYSDDYDGKFFQNNATPRLHINLENAGDKELKAFMGYVEEKLKGQPHRNIVTRGKVNIDAISIKNVDAEFNGFRKGIRERVIAGYKVQPIILGILDTSGATSDAQIALFKSLAVNPIRKIIENRINKKILNVLFPDFDVKFKFNSVDLLDEVIQSQKDERDLKSGVMVIDEIRKNRGLLPAKGGYGEFPLIPYSDASLAVLPGESNKNKDVDEKIKPNKKLANKNIKDQNQLKLGV